MTGQRDLEVRYQWVSLAAVVAFGLALASGLLLYLLRPDSRAAQMLLQAGLVLLMLSPAVRLLVAVAERIRRRDWSFVLMTALVVVELGIVMWRAAQKL